MPTIQNSLLYETSPPAVVPTVIPRKNGSIIWDAEMANLMPIVATPGALLMISETAGYMPVSRKEFAIPPTIAHTYAIL